MNYYNENIGLQAGLNGWGWWRRAISNVLHTVGKVVPLVALVATAFDEFAPEGKTAISYEPTLAEQKILQTWLDKKFTPFYEKLALQVNSVFGNDASPSTQLLVLNEAVAKMCVIRGYYATNETAGLSISAVEKRMELINILFETLENMIDDSFISDTISIETYNHVATNTSLFAPISIPVNSAYTCERYRNNVPVSQQNNTPILPTQPVVINPVTSQPITIKNNPVTSQPVSAVIDEPIKNNPSTPTKNNNTMSFVLVGVAILIGLFVKEKKSIKN